MTDTIEVKQGTEFRSVVADANPLWRCVREVRSGVWEAECVNEPMDIGGKMIDSDFAGEVRLFPVEDIESKLGFEEMWKGRGDDSAAWWASQPDGAVVHYSNGFGTYVRGVIETGPEGKRMRPVGLVGHVIRPGDDRRQAVNGHGGGWNWYDLPHRWADGTVDEGRWSSHRDHLTRPHASSMVECPKFTVKHHTPEQVQAMPLIDLTVPPETEQHRRIARLRKIQADAEAILDGMPFGRDDGDTDLDEIEATMQSAFGVLQTRLNQEIPPT